jgi:hypothetical protein
MFESASDSTVPDAAHCLVAADPVSVCIAQELEKFPDAALTTDQWQQRVQGLPPVGTVLLG